MTIVNQETMDGFTKSFNTIFNKSFEVTENFYQKVAMTVPSNTSAENYGWMGDIPDMRKWVGDRTINRLGEHGHTIVNEDFEVTIGIKRNKIEDDQYGIYTPMVEGMGRSAKRWPDKLTFGLLEKGFEKPCYDGQYFFDTDHPVGDGTASNMQAGTSTPWFLMDTTQAIKPLVFQLRKAPKFDALTGATDENVFMRKEFLYGADARGNAGYALWQLAFGSKAALNEANFRAAFAAMASQVNDQGQPLAIRANVLVIPSTLEDTAKNLLEVEKIGGTNNTLYKRVDILVVPYLRG